MTTQDPSPLPERHRHARRNRTIGVVAVVVAVAAAMLWHAHPARRLDRALARIEPPADVVLVSEERDDVGWLFCHTNACSSAYRDYVSSVSPQETAERFAASLRVAGFAAVAGPCGLICDANPVQPGPKAFVRGSQWDVKVAADGLGFNVEVGRRADGQVAVTLSIWTD